MQAFFKNIIYIIYYSHLHLHSNQSNKLNFVYIFLNQSPSQDTHSYNSHVTKQQSALSQTTSLTKQCHEGAKRSCLRFVYIWFTLFFFLLDSFLLSVEDDLREIEDVPLMEVWLLGGWSSLVGEPVSLRCPLLKDDSCFKI